MITEHDLDCAIAECQGEKSPNSRTCMKLAAFLTIKKELFGNTEQVGYSYTAQDNNTVGYLSDTEFGQLIYGKDNNTMWAKIDELMTTLQILSPKLYRSIIKNIAENS